MAENEILHNTPHKKKRIFDKMPVKQDLIDLNISNINNKNEISDNPRTKKRIFDKMPVKQDSLSLIHEVQHTIKGQTLNKNKFISNQK